MAAKKTTKPAVKAAETAKVETVVAKAEPIKAEVKAEVKEETKAPAKKETAKAETKAAAKKETAKAETKAAAKKPATKTAAKKTTKKTEVVSNLHVQFGGKSYSQEDLMKMAKDVWKYDLKQKVGDLAQVELYVKPEENAVYYVMNKEFTGSFYI